MFKNKNKYDFLFFCIVIILSTVLYFFDKNKNFFYIVIYILFLIDYIVRFVRSEKKIEFIFKNPLDFIAILPFSSGFRIIAFYRLAKIFHFKEFLMKRIPLLVIFFKNNYLGIILGWLIFVLSVASYLIMLVEPDIITYSDAMWWSVVTTTTVGYGDIVPKTIFGRALAVFLMVFGIGLMGLVINNITDILSRKKFEKNNELIVDFPDELKANYFKLDKKDKEEINTILEKEILKKIKKYN